MGRLDDIMDTVEKVLLSRCKLAILAVDPTADLILFGSRARGDADEDSDYDLLILTDGDAGLKREDIFRQALYPLELETGAVLTVMAYNRQTWETPIYQIMPFSRNVRQDGISL